MSGGVLGIDHVGLTVSDLDLACNFFTEALGFKIVGGNPKYPAQFVSNGHCTVTLWRADAPDKANEFNRKQNLGLHHLALRVQSRHLESLFESLRNWPGVKVEKETSIDGKGPNQHFFISMPGGPRLEFTSIEGQEDLTRKASVR